MGITVKLEEEVSFTHMADAFAHASAHEQVEFLQGLVESVENWKYGLWPMQCRFITECRWAPGDKQATIGLLETLLEHLKD